MPTSKSGNNQIHIKKLQLHEKNRVTLNKYNVTAWFYDILDFPWELKYRKWRPGLVGDMRGNVLEAGVGTGRNFKHYHHSVNLTGLDLSPAMLKRAQKRSREASCSINLIHEDACQMEEIPSDTYDWVMAGFLCCVLPDEFQSVVLQQIERILKPNGRFRLLEMIYSKNSNLRKRQDFFTPFVEKVYSARFDRNTLEHVKNNSNLKITGTTFLKHDVYQLIDGVCEK